jgi:hypothetical protein
VNQLGEVQPVGGINEKIEGYFDLCRRKGLTGGQVRENKMFLIKMERESSFLNQM